MDDQAFLADPDSDILFHLNPVGTAVWRLLDQPVSVEEITGLLCDAFPDVAMQQVESDVCALFEQMTRQGLVVITETS